MTRRSYKGSSLTTTLSGPISNTDLTATVTDGSSLPDGISAPFVLTLDLGVAGEEKILCASRTGNNLVITTRGYDGTTATSHSSGASVRHTISAVDLDEANAHVNATSGVHGRTGALVGTTDVQTLTNKTLTTPTIGSFTNAQHNHTNAAGGGVVSASGFSGARAYRAAALDHSASGGFQAMPLDAESFDSGALHSTVTNPSRITVPTTGKYAVSGALRFVAGTAGAYRAAQLWKNGAAVAATWLPGSNTTMSCPVSDILDCTAGDYIEIAGYQDSGGNLAYSVSSAECFLSVALLGA